MCDLENKKNCKGFTIIEIIIVIALLGIISAASSSFFMPMINLCFITSPQIETQSVGDFIYSDLINGNGNINGLRNIQNIVSADSISINYVDQNSNNIIVTWDSSSKELKRIVSGISETLPILYSNNNVKLAGQSSGNIFVYYSTSETLMSSPIIAPVTIGRIQLDWMFYSGDPSGNLMTYDTKYLLNSGINIHQF